VWKEKIMMAKRILVPLDGSESAEVAASLAADLARGSGGDRPAGAPDPRHRVSSTGRVVATRTGMERLNAEGRDYLERRRLTPVPTESVVRFGEPAQRSGGGRVFDADLIVLPRPRGWLNGSPGAGWAKLLTPHRPGGLGRAA
jgi:nucleotide-binding universal stress UspA family protein